MAHGSGPSSPMSAAFRLCADDRSPPRHLNEASDVAGSLVGPHELASVEHRLLRRPQQEGNPGKGTLDRQAGLSFSCRIYNVMVFAVLAPGWII